MSRRVAVTGAGAFSCLGAGLAATREALRAGRSGIVRLERWAELGLRSTVAGLAPEVPAAALPDPRQRPAMGRVARLAVAAAREAVEDAGLAAAELGDAATGCYVGSGGVSMPTIWEGALRLYSGRARRVTPWSVLRSMGSTCSAHVAHQLGIRGPSWSPSAACATGAIAIGQAVEEIRRGRLTRVIAGAAEEVSEILGAAFDALRTALSRRFADRPEEASRPFDRDRDGFVLAEGAGILVLEDLAAARRRGARVRAEVLGWAATTDLHDLTLPDPSGEASARAIDLALRDAGIGPAAVDYVNAHATGTRDGDPAEAAALRRVFGAALPLVSSTKSAAGHALGAASALETVHCVAMLEDGFVAPSLNVERVDPEMADLPLVLRPIEKALRIVVNNSFGFGGANAVLVLGRPSP